MGKSNNSSKIICFFEHLANNLGFQIKKRQQDHPLHGVVICEITEIYHHKIGTSKMQQLSCYWLLCDLRGGPDNNRHSTPNWMGSSQPRKLIGWGLLLVRAPPPWADWMSGWFPVKVDFASRLTIASFIILFPSSRKARLTLHLFDFVFHPSLRARI